MYDMFLCDGEEENHLLEEEEARRELLKQATIPIKHLPLTYCGEHTVWHPRFFI